MSGFVALYHPDGRPAERARLAPLIGTLSYRGPDGVGAWQHGCVALGHARLAPSLEAALPQPLVRDDCAIVFAGRLDNRAEIAAALPRQNADMTADASLALGAYREWGEESAARLLGDFAYAIWDGPRRKLVCARDAMGQKPLFYHAADGLVLVASEPRAILADPDVPRDVHEAVVAEHLIGILQSRDATLNAAVRRLPAAHLLVADALGCRTRRYWDFDRGREIRYARDSEYAEHFVDLLSRAIECRLPATSPVTLFLSGGLDSSAIAGVAARLATARAVPLLALALRFPGRACDEGDHIEAVARHTAIPLRAIDMSPAPAEAYRAEAAAALDVPQYPNGTILDPLRRAAREAGARVALTGYGGDDWFTGSPAHTTDLLRRGRLVAAWRQLRADARLPGRNYSLASLARGALAPVVPAPVRSVARLLRRHAPPFDWIRPEFRRRICLDDRLRPERVEGFRSLAQSEVYRVATCAATMIGDEMEERAAAAAGIEQRHPFNDRRLAEFGLALPEPQRWSGGKTKVVLRRALRLHGGVPESVLARDDKAEFSSSFVDAVQAFGGSAAFTRLRTADRGWVDEDKVRALYGRMMSLYRRGDEAYIPVSGFLWSILSLELWLEALEGNGDREHSGTTRGTSAV